MDERKQNVAELDFTPAKADSSNPEALLQAAIKNEKNLYYRTSSFVYDQSVELNCWKKRKVAEKLVDSLQVSRTERGEVLKRRKIEGVRVRAPKCVVDLNAINTDTYETFWAAPYLDQMEVKFDRFSELDGKRVARYSVSKPDRVRFERIAKKFPFVKPFRVFFGTLFVSAEDAQIVKFWGSSYPQATTTGIKSEDVHAGYNATAVREKLESGLWVTTKLNTVAVARTKGKDRPFSYVVNYSNYRQTETEVEVLDDEEIVASN